MIQYGNSAIADVKYGASQIERVCRGSNIIWQKNQTVAYEYPNAAHNHATDTTTTIIASQNYFTKYGISIAKLTSYDANTRARNMLDNDASTYWYATGSVSNTMIPVYFDFPVNLKTITVVNRSDKNYGLTGLTLQTKQEQSDTSWNEVVQASPYVNPSYVSGWTGAAGLTQTMNIFQLLDESESDSEREKTAYLNGIKCIRIYLVNAQWANSTNRSIAELRFGFEASSSDLAAAGLI